MPEWIERTVSVDGREVVLSGPPGIIDRIQARYNAYDDLIAQRDALVEACEALMHALQDVPIGEIWSAEDVEMVEDAMLSGRAALALVRGEVSDANPG